MRPYEWMCLGGVEISNIMRTLSYVKEGLAGGSFNPTLGDVPGELSDHCEACYDGPYEHPAEDPAPWYEDTRPESADFLGLIANQITVDDVAYRRVEPQAGMGGSLGPLEFDPRKISVKGVLVANGRAGMNYGKRWLAEALTGAYCGNGNVTGGDSVPNVHTATIGDDLEILPACPTTDQADWDRWFRTLKNVTLSEVPQYAPPRSGHGCLIEEVQFEFTAGNPFLFGEPEAIADEYLLVGNHSAEFLVDAPEWIGDAVVHIQVQPQNQTGGDFRVRAFPTQNNQCPSPNPVPAIDFTATDVPWKYHLSVDAVMRDTLEYDVQRKLWVPAWERLSWKGRWKWFDVPPCRQFCVQIDNLGTGALEIWLNLWPREI